MSNATILIVEDDPELRKALEITLNLAGFSFHAFANAESAIPNFNSTRDQILVTDFRLPGMNGLDLLAESRRINPATPVVIMTAFADTRLAVDALKAGARDFLIKPFSSEQLVEVISRLLPSASPPPMGQSRNTSAIIANDPATFAALQRCERAAKTDTTILLSGESGTGKDVFAKHIHLSSPRKPLPFIAINCAAIPDNLLEATLFGYEKGAFTGANQSHSGKFEQADGGTLFLDEIGDLPLELQPKLLRVLQDQVVERLGSKQPKSCNVRIIAATNRDLHRQVQAGKFREDLYFRLAVFPIDILPLRARPLDIGPLSQYFVERYGKTMGRDSLALSEAAQHKLRSHHWPGNIRELENVIQRAILLSDSDLIEPVHIESEPPSPSESFSPRTPQYGSSMDGSKIGMEIASNSMDIQSVERDHILKVMKQVKGNRKTATELLGISERALRYKLKAYKEAGFLID